MKKYFITSDVHSFYDELKMALSKKGFQDDNPDHILVVPHGILCGEEQNQRRNWCITV